MTTVAGLFDTQKDAQDAIEALAEKPFADEIDFTFIDDPNETVTEGTLFGGSGMASITAPITLVRGKIAALDVNDSVQTFMRRGVERGGVIVSVECDDEYADAVKETMRQQNAQFEDVE